MDAQERRLDAGTWAFFLALAALPFVHALVHLGRIQPDEVFQYLEPAYYRVRGYGLLPWEWHDGLRNWAIPGVLAGLLRLSDALGIESPRIYRAVLALPQLVLHLAVLRATFHWAARRVGRRDALLAVVLVAIDGIVISAAGRTLGEAYSGAFLVLAFDCLDALRPRPRPFLAGVWLGLSVVARYGSAVFVIGCMGVLLWRRAWRVLLPLALGGLLVLAGLTVLDWVTWGAPLHSLIAYVRFNVFSHRAAAQFGTMPWWFFLKWGVLLSPAWMLVALGSLTSRRAFTPVAIGVVASLVYILAISVTPHKEERFLYPACLVLAVVAAAETARALRGLGSGRARTLLTAACVIASPLTFPFLHAFKGNRYEAVISATRDADARGVLILDETIWGTPGYFYVGKNIPIATCRDTGRHECDAAVQRKDVNRAVTEDPNSLPMLEHAGFRVRDRIGRAFILVR